ncbi:MAG TPA: hypothetical protein VHZ55_28005 [Bryobacteraceae bacterium]|nr:hypothetical protein [Bryobacteraceae bacterium]
MHRNRNPVQAADAVVIAEMRAANAENKRKVIGPEARTDSDAILLSGRAEWIESESSAGS